MTDKLQDVAEQFIADNWWCIVHEDQQCDCSSGFVSTDYLRDFLAQYVLCGRQSIAAINTSSGEVVATWDAAYFGTNWMPLHAPAKGSKP